MFVLNQNVELVLRILATPILLKHSLVEFICRNDFIASFFLIEVTTLPDVHLMLVMFMARNIDLSTDAKNQELVFLKVFEVENRGGLVPVRICVKPWLHLFLLFYNVPVVSHLVYQRFLLHIVNVFNIYDKIVPLSNVSIKLIG